MLCISLSYSVQAIEELRHQEFSRRGFPNYEVIHCMNFPNYDTGGVHLPRNTAMKPQLRNVSTDSGSSAVSELIDR